MSVIVYRSGQMAADTRAFLDRSSPSPGAKAKIRRLEDGQLIGVVSPTPGCGEVLMDWYANGADPSADIGGFEDFILIAVTPKGQAYIYYDKVYPTGPIKAPYFAVGSGETYAMGAMFMGADAKEAVRAACKFDAMCGLPILSFTHAK